MKVGREPWSYMDRAAALMGRSSSVVDLDTGGGEKLQPTSFAGGRKVPILH